MKFIWVLLLWAGISVFNITNARAQVIRSLVFENPGLQIGMYQGQTDLKDSGYNYYFRIYNQHILGPHLFGELSLSSGTLSGLAYRSRITPLEYRLGFLMDKFGVPNPNLFGKKGAFYTYAGLGILYNRPIAIAAPDDPLTVEMGNSLPGSSFWNFDGGISPFIPIGVGMEVALDPNTRFTISAGYNQTLSMLKFNSHDVPNGYWALSIGLDFGRSKKSETFIPLPAPPPARTFTPPATYGVKEAQAEAVDIRYSNISYQPINFDVLSSHLNDDERSWIAEVADLLQQRPDLNLLVIGHADATGTDLVNQMISESRARSVWLSLLEEGVDLNRLKLEWYSNNRPVSSNNTREGRYQNRRVELRTTSSAFAEKRFTGRDEIFISSIVAGFEYGKPLLSAYEIQFTNSMLGLDRYGEMLIQLVAYLMHSVPEMNMVLISRAESGPGEQLRESLAKARAELIKGELILKGIDHSRITAVIPGTALYEEYKSRLSGHLQQNILIPVRGNAGD